MKRKIDLLKAEKNYVGRAISYILKKWMFFGRNGNVIAKGVDLKKWHNSSVIIAASLFFRTNPV
ncbi:MULTISPECIES: hypothetical protein [unclassified Enterobacter cloacae complex]|uniref:hypothetical protein n=1 Tax=unclassified Enterobacter cloacae complex TaxID=2757714 RepID=UPI00187329F4|nr:MULTISPECIES: hypothetical protein [unclassified Enterobacter cloacae complex]MBE4811307.1 hypothetical protein [Enterobacter cloacae complex sp. P44RS]MBE4830265.1 hypothetical protein [Enterobacter cloacae complex sp. P42RS]MBE4837410.1 hypothetical protein [Enterobacter cloacae complex sp. P46RS]MBE4842146.1 hypothetical protein [Enterobacter cloacae complex sp. P42C]